MALKGVLNARFLQKMTDWLRIAQIVRWKKWKSNGAVFCKHPATRVTQFLLNDDFKPTSDIDDALKN